VGLRRMQQGYALLCRWTEVRGDVAWAQMVALGHPAQLFGASNRDSRYMCWRGWPHTRTGLLQWHGERGTVGVLP